MSNNNTKKSTLVYNGGSMKFNSTGGDFKHFQVTENKKIGQLLDLFSGDESSAYSLDYEKPLDSYNIRDFFFFYEEVKENTKMDLSFLRVKDDAKRFLIFVDIKNADFAIEGTCSWIGEEPKFLKNNQYLFLVEKLNDLRFNLTLIARSVERNNVLKLKFKINEDEEELDLINTFPEYILGFKPRYNGYISFGDEDELFKFYFNSPALKHKYAQKGEYIVTITGVCEGLGQVPHNCTECIEIKGVKYFGKCFSYCTNFTTFPDNFFHGIGTQHELNGCFQGTKITRIPSNLFPENTTLKKIVSLFSECVGLNDVDTEEGGEIIPKDPVIPEDLFKPLKNLEELVSVFDSSYYISKIPKNIIKYNTKLKNVDRAFSMIGLDLGDTSIENEKHLSLLDNIPEGIVDGKNIRTTESVFSGLGFGRIIRHLDHKRNPHETTLQQAYDAQQTSQGGITVNTPLGITFERNIEDENSSDLKILNSISPITKMSKMGILSGKYNFYGFSTGIDEEKINNVVSGAPLRLDFPAEEDNQAVTLKQLRQAELNGIELIGSWNINENTTDYSTLGSDIKIDEYPPKENEHLESEEEKFKVGSCYYVRVEGNKSARIEIDKVWWSTGDYLLIIGPKGDGWTSSGENPNISKIENNPSIKTVFENQNVNESTAYLGDVTKKVVKNGYVFFQLPATPEENTILKTDNDKGFEIKSNGDITVNGNIISNGNISVDGIISQPLTPTQNAHLTNKEYVDTSILNNSIEIKSLDNINNDPTKIDSAWFGMNMFKNQTYFEDSITISGQADFSNKVDFGSSDIGWFRFNFVDDDENLKRFEFINSLKEISYRLDCDNSSVKQTFELTDGESDHKESLILDSTNNLFEKSYNNIPVKTNKEGLNNFDSNEFITKSVVEEAIEDFSKNFQKTTGEREVYFDGNANNNNATGCRFVLKNNAVSGMYKISQVTIFGGSSGGTFYGENDLDENGITRKSIRIGLYVLNDKDIYNENGVLLYPKWSYPTKLVAYSTNNNVKNLFETTESGEIIGKEMVFDQLVLAEPRVEKLNLEGNNEDRGRNPRPEDAESEKIPFKFLSPDPSDENSVWWDAEYPMMIIFFDYEEGRLPPIEGSYLTRNTPTWGKQTFAYYIGVRCRSGTTSNQDDETQSLVIPYSNGAWEINTNQPENIKYQSNMCLKASIKMIGNTELIAFGVGTSGNNLLGTNNNWRGVNDFYKGSLTYKKGTTDTEVATIQLIKENLFPVNSVFSTTVENSYPSLPNTSWSLLGTQEVGGSTIYYYKRTY